MMTTPVPTTAVFHALSLTHSACVKFDDCSFSRYGSIM